MPRTEQAPAGARAVTPRREPVPPSMSVAVDLLIKRARVEAESAESPLVETAHVALALFSGDTFVSRVLRSLIDEKALRAVLRQQGVKVSR